MASLFFRYTHWQYRVYVLMGVLWTLQGHYMLGLALLQKEDYAEGVRQLEKVITSHKYYLIKIREIVMTSEEKRLKELLTLKLHDINLSLFLNRKKRLFCALYLGKTPFFMTKKICY